jgi:hypothetical protein
MLVRADDPWRRVDDGAVEINEDGEYGGSCVKADGTVFPA